MVPDACAAATVPCVDPWAMLEDLDEDVVGLSWSCPLVTADARFCRLTCGNGDFCCPVVTAAHPYSGARVGMKLGMTSQMRLENRQCHDVLGASCRPLSI